MTIFWFIGSKLVAKFVNPKQFIIDRGSKLNTNFIETYYTT